MPSVRAAERFYVELFDMEVVLRESELPDGWATVQQEAWVAPGYWRSRDGQWLTMSLAGLVPVDPALPVCHVSYYVITTCDWREIGINRCCGQSLALYLLRFP